MWMLTEKYMNVILEALHMSGGRKNALYPDWVPNLWGASDWTQYDMLLHIREA
jgi:hypothetical protein